MRHDCINCALSLGHGMCRVEGTPDTWCVRNEYDKEDSK